MSFISFLRSRKLRPRWTFETPSQDTVIWKLLLSPQGVLCGEIRDIASKTASLFAIDAESGKELWRDMRVDEPWWFSTEFATTETLLLQTFRQPDLPEPKGIIAIDLESGTVRWRQPEMSVLFACASRVYAMRQGFSVREYYELDEHTGEITREFAEDQTEILALRTLSSEADNANEEALYASLLEPESPYFTTACDLLKSVFDVDDLRGAIEYLELGDWLVFSFHARVRSGPEAMLRNMLRNELVVLDRTTGEVRFQETLHRETPLPLPDNFFVYRRTLLYVKEKQTLAGLPLP